MTHAPSVVLERLLTALLDDDASAAFVVGDLREEYAALRARVVPPCADIWYLLQALRIGLRVRWERSHHPSTRTLPGDVMKTELRQASRFLRRRPAFSLAIVLTVALAIAATTLAFAVVDGVLLEPLPYAQPDRLVSVWEHSIARNRDHNVASPANTIAWRENLRSFDGLAALVEFSTTMLGESEAERVGGVQASAEYFELVGAQPLIGRFYTVEEDDASGPSLVVLSEGFWRRRFAADPAVLGTEIHVDDRSATVVGVLPARYDFPVRASFGGIGQHDVWLAPRWGPSAREAGGRFLEVLARLAPGATVEGAQSEASTLAARLADENPQRMRGWDVNVVPLREDLTGDVRSTILIVFGAVCFVLLIACANVANLLMTRATERQQEIAVRSALGAGRGRLIRQLLAESMILSLVGGSLGVLLAGWGLRSLIASAPDIPRLDAVGLDASVVAFALFATLVTAVLFGLAPALHLVGADVAGWLKERGTAGRRGAQRIRGALVIAQVALSLILLIGAGLLVRSLINRLDVGVGFDVHNVMKADVQTGDRYEGSVRQTQFFEELIDRVAVLPGVVSASGITFAPLAGPGSATSIWAMDRPIPEAGQFPTADIRWVHRDYHETMRIPLLQGRYLNETDRAAAPTSVLISETGAELLWPGENALGKRIAMPWGDTVRAEVVGIVGDVRHNGPDTELRTMLYFDHRQHRAFDYTALVVRTTGAPADIVPAVRRVLADVDRELPLYNVNTMEGLLGETLARARFTTLSLGLFALLALLLAAIGIYGVIAYATEQRSQEIGIRMALGADRGSVVRMVVRQGMVLVAIALVVGMVGAFALSRVLQGLVFDVSTADPVTFAAMAVLLGVIGAVACWLPAKRASGISPVEAIRYE